MTPEGKDAQQEHINWLLAKGLWSRNPDGSYSMTKKGQNISDLINDYLGENWYFDPSENELSGEDGEK